MSGWICFASIVLALVFFYAGMEKFNETEEDDSNFDQIKSQSIKMLAISLLFTLIVWTTISWEFTIFPKLFLVVIAVMFLSIAVTSYGKKE